MKTKDFWYDLPEDRIAQEPAEPRDASRLLSYDRKSGDVRHGRFRDLVDLLGAGDVLILNETRVLPARLHGTKRGSGTPVEFLLLRQTEPDTWQVIMRPGRKLPPGTAVDFPGGLAAEVRTKDADGVCTVRFSYDGRFEEILEQVGETPLPPYIHASAAPRDRYQTVYARTSGSAAAPTAGLHFTSDLLERLKKKDVEVQKLLLHVGLGTFRPVKAENLDEHEMHAEYFELPEETALAVNRAHRETRRVIAVGTTVVRALESAWNGREVLPQRGETSIFIRPGVPINSVDAIITNFHLPESTLLMLVASFVGSVDKTLDLYREAVEKNYRFFSFGDAMFLT